MENEFDFKIRDELHKMSEFKDLRSLFLHAKITSEAGVSVTGEMIIDMITYCSKGDLDVAIRGLVASKLFIDGCLEFLLPTSYQTRVTKSINLLFEIWRFGFVATKCLLEVDCLMEREDFEESYIPTQSIPEEEVASMIADNQMNLTFMVKFLQIYDHIDLFQSASSLLHEVWKSEHLKIPEIHK